MILVQNVKPRSIPTTRLFHVAHHLAARRRHRDLVRATITTPGAAARPGATLELSVNFQNLLQTKLNQNLDRYSINLNIERYSTRYLIHVIDYVHRKCALRSTAHSLTGFSLLKTEKSYEKIKKFLVMLSCQNQKVLLIDTTHQIMTKINMSLFCIQK